MSSKSLSKSQLRFLSKIRFDSNGCWMWLAGCFSDGYGCFSLVESTGKQKLWRAHRLSWLFFRGAIPEGLSVCHTCDTPKCVNPYHLWLGTTAENQQDMVVKGRGRVGERNGSARLTVEQVKEIRQRFKRQGVTKSALAKEFHVGETTVSQLLKGDTWRSVL